MGVQCDPNDLVLSRRFAAEKAVSMFRQNALGVFLRKPVIDEECPSVSDLDFTLIWNEAEECPERIVIDAQGQRVFIDVLWVPVSSLLEPSEAAAYKILPHLLLESEAMWMRPTIEPLIENIRLKTYNLEIWQRRIGHQLSFGDAAVEEAEKNLDFPSASIFFLQTAHSYYIMALSDCLKRSTMSLLTKPVNKLKMIDAELGCDLTALMENNLKLDRDPCQALDLLRQVFKSVSTKCADLKPMGVNMRTLCHFEYTLSPLELDYRETIARCLVEKGDFANANFFVRFWAYSLSRCPIILKEGRDGKKPSFYVPFSSLYQSLLISCPEIIDDMKSIFDESFTQQDACKSIIGTKKFRNIIVGQIKSRGLMVK